MYYNLRLKELREYKDITQAEMAKILNISIVCINSKVYKNNNRKATDVLNKYYKQ